MHRHIHPLEARRLLSAIFNMSSTAVATNVSWNGLVDGSDYSAIDYGVVTDDIPLPLPLPSSGVVPFNPTEFSGTARRDVITVTAADNGAVTVTVSGYATTTAAGRLTIYGNGGNDKIHIDLPDSYAHWLITINGGAGDDAIVGSAAAERIIAEDGNDYVVSGGGRDTVYGGNGDDSLRGGGSSDLLDGGAGNDTLRGDAGNDNISGGDGSDRIRGNAGNDNLDGGASRDYIGGESGNDRVFGGGGADALSGGEDDDQLDGGAGNDHCAGDAGHDNLAGGSGVDQLFGGDGTDRCATEDDLLERADADLADLAPPGGKLDLNDNKLIIDADDAGTFTGGAYTGVQGLVQSAFNSGAWSQPGLTTGGGATTIGVATGEQILGLGPTDTAVFAGQTITGSSTIAMYTYAGDANLDGVVNDADYAILDASILIPGASGWANGDFNYDGVINAADYAVIDAAAAAQGVQAVSGS